MAPWQELLKLMVCIDHSHFIVWKKYKHILKRCLKILDHQCWQLLIYTGDEHVSSKRTGLHWPVLLDLLQSVVPELKIYIEYLLMVPGHIFCLKWTKNNWYVLRQYILSSRLCEFSLLIWVFRDCIDTSKYCLSPRLTADSPMNLILVQ